MRNVVSKAASCFVMLCMATGGLAQEDAEAVLKTLKPEQRKLEYWLPYVFVEDGKQYSDPWYEKAHVAMKVVPLLMTERDVPRFTRRIDLVDRKRDRDEDNAAVADNALEAVQMLVGYYAHTGDRTVEDYFLKVVKEAEPARLEYLVGSLQESVSVRKFGRSRYRRPIKGVCDSGFIRRLHQQYRRFDKLESSFAAVELLIGIDRYRPEMIWFLCTVMKEPRYEVSKTCEKDWKTRSGLATVTRRQIAQVTAKEILGVDAQGRQDVETLKTYHVPWDKTLNEIPALKPLTGHSKFPFWQRSLPIDNVNIPAGQPVPPKPETVVEFPAAGNDPTGQPDERE